MRLLMTLLTTFVVMYVTLVGAEIVIADRGYLLPINGKKYLVIEVEGMSVEEIKANGE